MLNSIDCLKDRINMNKIIKLVICSVSTVMASKLASPANLRLSTYCIGSYVIPVIP